VINLAEARASSAYDGVRVELSRRLHSALGFQATYMYGKARDDISAAVSTLCPNGFGCLPVNQFELSENYGTADFDVRHTWVANVVHELPFGDGRKFASAQNALVRTLVSGWSVGAILSYWNGLPFDVLSGIDNNGDGIANDRARVVPGADPRDALTSESSESSSTQYLDPAAVGTVLSQTTGTPLPRNFYRGPAIVNLDARLEKRTPLGNGRSLYFGAEIFNVLNHTNFANPVNSLSSPTFGRIVSTATRSREVQLAVRLAF
jgi:hypothetical protein